MTKENGAAAKGNPVPDSLPKTSERNHSAKRAKMQPARTVLPNPMGHLIGSPVVVVDEIAGQSAVVRIATLDRIGGEQVLGPAPWGWSGKDKTFLCLKPRSSMAWRYVEELRSVIRLKAVDELEFRHRREAARRAEREPRQ